MISSVWLHATPYFCDNSRSIMCQNWYCVVVNKSKIIDDISETDIYAKIQLSSPPPTTIYVSGPWRPDALHKPRERAAVRRQSGHGGRDRSNPPLHLLSIPLICDLPCILIVDMEEFRSLDADELKHAFWIWKMEFKLVSVIGRDVRSSTLTVTNWCKKIQVTPHGCHLHSMRGMDKFWSLIPDLHYDDLSVQILSITSHSWLDPLFKQLWWKFFWLW
jgi:hypothetical protein